MSGNEFNLPMEIAFENIWFNQLIFNVNLIILHKVWGIVLRYNRQLPVFVKIL